MQFILVQPQWMPFSPVQSLSVCDQTHQPLFGCRTCLCLCW
jgi:hypothetical protein